MLLTDKTAHLQYRAGFALPAGQTLGHQSFDELMRNWAQERTLNVVPKPEAEDYIEMRKRKGKGGNVLKSREKLIELNSAWLGQMSTADTMVREKFTLFWHDHFACRNQIVYLAQQHNNTLRHHALGKFSDLLMAISKDPAMLQFLNNQQNKKDSPNENFAREVLELFTLGRGHYSESDIKNAARSFTGWAFNPATGEFQFRTRVHDQGVKTFRNKSGNFTGEDIIEMVLADRQTARFITEKIWHYFVSTDTRDAEIIATLAEDFYKSDYAIDRLANSIFSSSWFYDERFRGNRIKSPVELLAGILIQTNGKFINPLSSIFAQRALGQVLLLPPNVGGWPSGKEWIDSSSLTFRLALPAVMLKDTPTHIDAKNDGDVNNVANQAGKPQRLSLQVDWSAHAQHFSRGNANEILDRIENFLLAKPATIINRKYISSIVAKSSDEAELTKNAFTAFMSLPEYQLS